MQFLVTEKGFKLANTFIIILFHYRLKLLILHSEDRVRKGAEKLQKYLNSKQQGRLDGFFTVKPKEKKSPAKSETKGKGKGKESAATKGKGTKRKVGLSLFNA